jgi:ribosomal protein uS19
MELVPGRVRRRFNRGLRRQPMTLIKKLRKAKQEAAPNEKPAVVKTHLRNMIIVPEMIGSIVGVHNGKVFNQVEIKVCIDGCNSSFNRKSVGSSSSSSSSNHRSKVIGNMVGNIESLVLHILLTGYTVKDSKFAYISG